MRRNVWWIVLVVMLIGLAGPGISAAQKPAVQTEMVPMPDGVRLATDVYLAEGSGPWPVLLVRTPYGRRDFASFAAAITDNGVAVVVQDFRGQFDSEGQGNIFFTDKQDGRVTLDWILAQPWSNGRVATYGASALGIAQYLLAPGAPDTLRCQWIEVATPDVYNGLVYQGGVYRSELVDLWLPTIGQSALIAPWKANHLNTAYWDPVQIVDEYDQVNALAVHVGGWYDIFAREIIDGFHGYQDQGGPGAAGRQHLIMGPWTHLVNNPQAGQLTFPNGRFASYEEWFGIWVSACLLEPTNDLKMMDGLPAVSYYTMGAVGEEGAPGSEWHEAGTWPPAGSLDVTLYLLPGNVLGTGEPGADGGGDSFTYNPGNPTPTVGGRNLVASAGPYNQQGIEGRSDMVIYSTAPLEEPVEVTGDLHAQIWITTDVPDTDIVVRLMDVYPDGRSMLVADGIYRARYRSSPTFSAEEWLTPGTPALITVDLGPTSIVFNTGHQIRVSVSSASSPRWLPNPNTGTPGLGTGQMAQIAHTTILYDAGHPSALILPVMVREVG